MLATIVSSWNHKLDEEEQKVNNIIQSEHFIIQKLPSSF